MTHEFEEWYKNKDYSSNPRKAAIDAWQASREQLKAKLLSDEMVSKISDVIEENGNASVQGEGYTLAKAALEAVVGEL